MAVWIDRHMADIDALISGLFNKSRGKRLAADTGEIGNRARHPDFACCIDGRVVAVTGKTERKPLIALGPDLGHHLADGEKTMFHTAHQPPIPSGSIPVGPPSSRQTKPLSPKAG